MRWLALAALAGCTGPSPILICHNASCAAGATEADDDTVAALRRSLALRTADGAVVFDGIELDAVWDRARGACTFAHAPDPAAPDFAVAVALVARHVATSPANRAGHGGALYFKVELKADVGGGDSHTAAEVALHVACVTAGVRTVATAGVASHNPVHAIFDSSEPALLAAIGPHGDAELETDLGAALPPGLEPDIWTLGWTRDGAAFADDGRARISIWARQPAPAELERMLARDPAYLVVNNVEEARGLIEARDAR